MATSDEIRAILREELDRFGAKLEEKLEQKFEVKLQPLWSAINGMRT